jgi:hypothetical protein
MHTYEFVYVLKKCSQLPNALHCTIILFDHHYHFDHFSQTIQPFYHLFCSTLCHLKLLLLWILIYLSFRSCDSCRRLPEPKHHSFLFKHWSASKCLVFVAARTTLNSYSDRILLLISRMWSYQPSFLRLDILIWTTYHNNEKLYIVYLYNHLQNSFVYFFHRYYEGYFFNLRWAINKNVTC